MPRRGDPWGDPADPMNFLAKARMVAYKLTRRGHRTTTMGEVAIADAINRLAAAVERIADQRDEDDSLPM